VQNEGEDLQRNDQHRPEREGSALSGDRSHWLLARRDGQVAGGEPEHRGQVCRPKPDIHASRLDDDRGDSLRDDGVVRGQAQAAIQVASHRSKHARVDAISSPVFTTKLRSGHGRANHSLYRVLFLFHKTFTKSNLKK